MKSLVASLGIALLASLAGPSLAQELSEEQVEEAKAFMLNNSIYVLYHEIGHLFVGEFGLPVLGKEEDAADNLAALLLLQAGDEASEGVLVDSADGWYWSSAADGQDDPVDDSIYYSAHSLDLQRSYAIVCLMVGKDAEYFAETADSYEIDADRRESCAWDYQQVSESWNSLLQPNEIGVSDVEPREIAVTYEDSETYAEIQAAMQETEFLEHAAEMVSQTYALPRDIAFVAQECGEQNAYYSGSEAQVTYCYELADFFQTLYVTNVFEEADAEEGEEVADAEEEAETEEE